jgi:hypothetical protein
MLTFRDAATRVPLVLNLSNSKYHSDMRNGRALQLLEGVYHSELSVLPLRGPKGTVRRGRGRGICWRGRGFIHMTQLAEGVASV